MGSRRCHGQTRYYVRAITEIETALGTSAPTVTKDGANAQEIESLSDGLNITKNMASSLVGKAWLIYAVTKLRQAGYLVTKLELGYRQASQEVTATISFGPEEKGAYAMTGQATLGEKGFFEQAKPKTPLPPNQTSLLKDGFLTLKKSAYTIKTSFCGL